MCSSGADLDGLEAEDKFRAFPLHDNKSDLNLNLPQMVIFKSIKLECLFTHLLSLLTVNG